MSQTSPAAPQRILALDGLRGIAALGIVLFHASAALAYSADFGFMAGWFYKYFLLLDLFFVVSGFGVASAYAHTFETRVTAKAYGRFLWSRFIRLYPLYLFVLIVLALQELVFLVLLNAGIWDPGYVPFEKPTANLENFLACLFLVQSWGFGNKLVWNIPAWYVSALICAYIAFPFIAWSAARLPQAWRAPLLIAVSGAGALALHAAYSQGMFRAPNDLSPLRAILEFTLGYGIALLKPGPAWKRFLQVPLLALVFWGLHHGWRDPVLLGLLALFLWSLLDDRGIVAAVLGIRPLVWLGAASYGIFLVHQPLLSWFDALGRSPLSHYVWILWRENFSWNIALRFVLIVIVGWLAQRMIANPAQRWLQRKPPKLPHSAATAGRVSR